MSAFAQWAKPPATGASGSTTVRARALVPAGTSVHASGGDSPAPAQVNWVGIGCPSWKALDVSRNAATAAVEPVLLPAVGPAVGPVDGAAVLVLDEHAASVTATRRRATPNHRGARCMVVRLVA